MATTLVTLRTRVRTFIDESAAGTFSNNDIDGYINDSELSLWMDMSEIDISFGLRESYLTLVQAQTDYLYPSDIMGRNVRSLTAYTSTGNWNMIPLVSYEEVIAEGVTQRNYPLAYCCMDGYLKIGPPPDASGYTLRMSYTRKPTAMTVGVDAGTMDSDDVFAELIAVGAAVRCLERTGVDVSPLEKRQAQLLQQVIGAVQPNDPRFAKCAWKY